MYELYRFSYEYVCKLQRSVRFFELLQENITQIDPEEKWSNHTSCIAALHMHTEMYEQKMRERET